MVLCATDSAADLSHEGLDNTLTVDKYLPNCLPSCTGKPGVKRDHENSTRIPQTAAGTPSQHKRAKEHATDEHMADATDAGFDAAAAAATTKQPVVYKDEHTVFVKGLGFDVGEEDLRKLFADLGVKSIRVGRDKNTGASRVGAVVLAQLADGLWLQGSCTNLLIC